MSRVTTLAVALAYWSGVVLAAAAITHLATVLLLPLHSPDDAYARLARLARGDILATIPDPAAGNPLPGQDPAFASAFCLYDLRSGAIQVDLDVSGADVATLAVYSRHGQVLYGLTNRSAAQDHLRLTIDASDQGAGPPKGDAPVVPDKVRVESAETDGIVMAQALASAPSARREAEAIAARLVCGSAPGKPRGGREPQATNAPK